MFLLAEVVKSITMKNTFLTALCSVFFLFACTDSEFLEDTDVNEAVTESESNPVVPTQRMLWASINGRSDATHSSFSRYNNTILVSWRLLPNDSRNISFDLYRLASEAEGEVKLNETPIVNSTNFQDVTANRNIDNTYLLKLSDSQEVLDTYTIKAQQSSNGLPYISIPLRNTLNIHSVFPYKANDISIGDLDGDGRYEIILKRLIETNDGEDDSEGSASNASVTHSMLLEAYRLDGTFMWRMCMGPNILTGNGGSFAVYDFNNDGKCEIALRTAEGTIFGDGQEIGDTNGDGKTDYRVDGANYIHGGPEFLSIIDGVTGKELARTDYIELGKSQDWGDNYYKRSSSYRIGIAKCSAKGTSIIIGRGCYAKIVVEAWNFIGNKLERLWRFDTTDGIHRDYEAQGYHSLSVGDVDDDGFDEIVYGSCTIDHNGKGLNNCGFGHGDALHLGKFDPSAKGMQIWSCFETGSVGAALRDAKTGKVLWQYDDPSDVGRCMVADIDPDSPGCEMWWYKGNAHSPSGVDLGYAPTSCNMAIWWSGSLNRQLLDRSTIDAPLSGRVFTLYRYDVTTINGTKANPCFYGDFLGDWREEVIQPTTDNTELRVFSTWYPCDYRFDYLMSDHVYEMSALNQNIGYNQPTHTSYYLGSDIIKK